MTTRKSITGFRFQPLFARAAGDDRMMWRLSDTACPDLAWIYDDRTLAFARKRDCEAACQSLNDAGIGPDDARQMDDEQFGYYVTRYLNW